MEIIGPFQKEAGPSIYDLDDQANLAQPQNQLLISFEL